MWVLLSGCGVCEGCEVASKRDQKERERSWESPVAPAPSWRACFNIEELRVSSHQTLGLFSKSQPGLAQEGSELSRGEDGPGPKLLPTALTQLPQQQCGMSVGERRKLLRSGG